LGLIWFGFGLLWYVLVLVLVLILLVYWLFVFLIQLFSWKFHIVLDYCFEIQFVSWLFFWNSICFYWKFHMVLDCFVLVLVFLVLFVFTCFLKIPHCVVSYTSFLIILFGLHFVWKFHIIFLIILFEIPLVSWLLCLSMFCSRKQWNNKIQKPVEFQKKQSIKPWHFQEQNILRKQ
jgi:hypothetical protein